MSGQRVRAESLDPLANQRRLAGDEQNCLSPGAAAVPCQQETNELLNGGCPDRRSTRATLFRRCHLGSLHRSEEHTSELQSQMRISYAVFCLKKKIINKQHHFTTLRPKNTSQQPTTHQ